MMRTPRATRPSRLFRASRVLAVALAAWSAAALAIRDRAVLDRFDFRKGGAAQARLPHSLREISDLSVSADGRVFAVNDERGIVFELDGRRGTVVKSFSLGAPAIRGDFEGLTIVDGRFFLITSEGRLYETREGEDRAAVAYTSYDTGLRAKCEIEGLTYEPSDRSLIIACKRPYDPALRGFVTLFRWSIDRKGLATQPRISIPLEEVIRGTGAKGFSASAVVREPSTGHYVAVAGPQRVIAEFTPAGAAVAARQLHRRTHRQPEGIAFLGDSAVLISDEGGAGSATLTLYPRVQ
jgi:uncharacterized protein YjiK